MWSQRRNSKSMLLSSVLAERLSNTISAIAGMNLHPEDVPAKVLRSSALLLKDQSICRYNAAQAKITVIFL